MKKVWTVVSIIAVANLLALLGFVGFLGATDRISKERLWKVRELFGTTVSIDRAAEEKAKTEAEEKAKADVEAKRRGGEPESASTRIEDHANQREILDQQLLRMREESRQLQDRIAAQRTALEQQQAMLDAAKKEHAERKAEWEKLATDEQFQQAIGVLETQKPADAVKMLKSILDGTAGGQEPNTDPDVATKKRKEVVIRYLAAMNDKTRTKIIAEFIKRGFDDERLAAELLELLRTRGGDGALPSPVAAGKAAP